MIELVTVTAGKLALTHRPRKAAAAAWRAQGVTHVVTLLTEREGARELGAGFGQAGLIWIWCPLESADTRTTLATVGDALDAARAALAGGGVVVVHCSAGIHRTGMFGYALLRAVGLVPAAARAMLGELRAVTAAGVGDERLAWGDRITESAASSRRSRD